MDQKFKEGIPWYFACRAPKFHIPHDRRIATLKTFARHQQRSGATGTTARGGSGKSDSSVLGVHQCQPQRNIAAIPDGLDEHQRHA